MPRIDVSLEILFGLISGAARDASERFGSRVVAAKMRFQIDFAGRNLFAANGTSQIVVDIRRRRRGVSDGGGGGGGGVAVRNAEGGGGGRLGRVDL